MFENSIWLLSKVEKKQHQNKRQYVQLSKCHTSKRFYTVSLSLSLALLLLFCCLQSDPLFACLASRHCFPLRWLTGAGEVWCWRGLIIGVGTKGRGEENIESSSPAALYRILGSKNMQGFLSSMQERSSPFACTGPRGTTICRRHDVLY